MNIRRSAISSIGQRRKAVSLLLAVLVMMTPSLYGTPRVHATTAAVTFTSPNSQPNGNFGFSVAVSGTSVVVGAYAEFGTGRVYIFSTTGSPVATLASPNPTGGEFGWSVAVSGSTVVVGAPDEFGSGVFGAGNAYIFSTTGSPIASVTSPNPQANGAFGSSVAVIGNNVVVGARNEFGIGGRVYVFSNTGGAPIATLSSPNAQLNGVFGVSVATSATNLIVGAPGENGFAGHAYICSTAACPVTGTLSSPNAQPNGFFGYTGVGIDGNSAVVGARDETANGFGQAGHAYICSLLACPASGTLTSPSSQTGGAFGSSTGISGSTVVVGAPGEIASGFTVAGHVYLCSTAGCPITGTVASPNAQTNGNFGFSLRVSGNAVLVGAPGENAFAGHAYLFLTAPTCKEADGNGDFHGANGNGNFHADDDQCEDGIRNQVSSTNVGDGSDFQSTQISTTTFDSTANTVTITGLGTHGGVPVAFTFVALETGPTTPGWVSFAFSDGYTNAGTLVSGSILLH